MDITVQNELDLIFEALGNEHRRAIIFALSLQPYPIHKLAQMRELSLPAIHKHIKILESAGLVTRKKVGRMHVLTLNRLALRGLQEWLTQFHTYWGTDLETLENYVPDDHKKMLGGEDL
jgi:DNA-binding transcriptional ArsR family regulator